MKRDNGREEPNITTRGDVRIPTTETFEAALEVLKYLRSEEGIESPDDVFTAIRAHIAPNFAARSPRADMGPRQGQDVPQDSQVTIAADAGFGPPESNGTKARYSLSDGLNEMRKQRP